MNKGIICVLYCGTGLRYFTSKFIKMGDRAEVEV